MTDLLPSNDDDAIRDYLDLTVSADLRAHQLAAARSGWPTDDLEAVAVLEDDAIRSTASESGCWPPAAVSFRTPS